MKIKEVIVVEGKHDSDTLHKYFDCDTIETGGLGLENKTIDLLKIIQEERGIIVFTDPDAPGERIRNMINTAVPGAKNAFIDKRKARTTKKVGIEHASYEDLKESLEHILTYKNIEEETISKQELIELGLNGMPYSAKLRQILGDILFIGKCNAKTIYKRLNMLGLNKQQVYSLLEEFYE